MTREKLISVITEMNNEAPAWEQISNNIENKFEEYKTYRKKQDNYYDEFNARVMGMVSGYESSIPTYTNSTPAPTIKMPIMQSTYCNVYGNSISCDSYSY